MKMGINENLSNGDYHGDTEFLSSSSLKLLLKDERAFYKQYIEKQKWGPDNKRALDTGTYIHSLVLEPTTISQCYALYTKIRRGKEWDAFRDANKGKIIIGKDDFELGAKIQTYLRQRPELKNFISDIEPEVSLGCELEGIKIKVRADALKHTEKNVAIIDVKTTISPLRDSSLAKVVESYDYDLSAALYVDAFATINESPGPFYLYFIRKKPVDVLIYRISDELLDNGRRKYKDAIKKYKHNLKTDDWCDNSIRTLDLNERFSFYGDI